MSEEKEPELIIPGITLGSDGNPINLEYEFARQEWLRGQEKKRKDVVLPCQPLNL